jgi:hypothetical protein
MVYGKEAAEVFQGRRVGVTQLAKKHGAETLYGTGFQGFGNTGCAAISLAVDSGAGRVLLLGYDAQRTRGLSHHHGDHPAPLGNAKSLPKWGPKFKQAWQYAARKKVRVINCTRETALPHFERMTLEQALAEH